MNMAKNIKGVILFTRKDERLHPLTKVRNVHLPTTGNESIIYHPDLVSEDSNRSPYKTHGSDHRSVDSEHESNRNATHKLQEKAKGIGTS